MIQIIIKEQDSVRVISTLENMGIGYLKEDAQDLPIDTIGVEAGKLLDKSYYGSLCEKSRAEIESGIGSIRLGEKDNGEDFLIKDDTDTFRSIMDLIPKTPSLDPLNEPGEGREEIKQRCEYELCVEKYFGIKLSKSNSGQKISGGLRWVRASERLPDDYKPNELIVIRIPSPSGVKVPWVCTYDKKEKTFYFSDLSPKQSEKDIATIEWLDETPSSSAPLGEGCNIQCQCKDEDKHGETSIMCCNHCGLPTGNFWTKGQIEQL